MINYHPCSKKLKEIKANDKIMFKTWGSVPHEGIFLKKDQDSIYYRNSEGQEVEFERSNLNIGTLYILNSDK